MENKKALRGKIKEAQESGDGEKVAKLEAELAKIADRKPFKPIFGCEMYASPKNPWMYMWTNGIRAAT